MKRTIIAATTVLLLLLCLIVSGQERRPAVREVDIAGAGKIAIPDIPVRDQNGRQVRFYSGLIKDKVVVLNFFYTSCIYTCTRQGKLFSNLQSRLGDRLGKSVFLISVTTDPAKDTPGQLKAWSKSYNVQPGWTLVTGDIAEMDKLLLPFTGNTAGGGMHLAATFIGNDKTGVWISGAGNFTPDDIVQAVDFVAQP